MLERSLGGEDQYEVDSGGNMCYMVYNGIEYQQHIDGSMHPPSVFLGVSLNNHEMFAQWFRR